MAKKLRSMVIYVSPKTVERDLTVGYGRREFNRGDDALHGVYKKYGDMIKSPLPLPESLHEWLAGALREGITFTVYEDDRVEARIGRK